MKRSEFFRRMLALGAAPFVAEAFVDEAEGPPTESKADNLWAKTETTYGREPSNTDNVTIVIEYSEDGDTWREISRLPDHSTSYGPRTA